MSSRRRTFRSSSDEGAVVFKRGREGEDVFDDSELIEAWNKQLRRMQEEGESKPIQFPTEEKVIEFESVGSSASESSVDSTVGSQSASKSAESVPATFHPPMPPGISCDLQDLLKAWFQAGFQTGRFVANSTAK